MYFIDTHAHLFAKEFNNDNEHIINRAIEANVKKIILPNINTSSILPLTEMCKKYPKNCFPMIGLHPCEVKDDFTNQLDFFEKWLNDKKNKAVGIGEIGIDLYWDKSSLKIQEKAFAAQIKLAKKFKLPIAIHVRESFNEVFKIIDALNDERLKGVFHCFTGNEKQALHIINYKNFKLGIGGVLTFKNSQLSKTLKNIALKHIVLETDSPYLAPHPYRGKRNESSYLILIAKKLAEIYNVSLEEIANTTTKNAEDLFNLNLR